jgi:benzoylformate decarboxylase
MATTVRESTFELLRALGLTTVFGNPGSTELPFLKDFPDDFRYVLGLQEASVVAMADGYAQATGRAALVNLHTAIGVGNAMGNVGTAYHNKSPLVITAGQQVRAMLPLEPFLFAKSATELPKPYVKWSYTPARPQEVPAALSRAYHLAMQRPRGPVFVSIPMDDWDAPGESYVPREVSHRTAPDPCALQRVAERLAQGERPALVVGADVDRHGAWEPTVALAERLHAAVWVAPNAECVGFPTDHRLFQGYLPSAHGPLADRLAAYDVIVVLGAPIFSYFAYVPGPVVHPGSELVQLTDDPDEAARAPQATSVVGDLALAVEQLGALVAPAQHEAPPRRPRPAPPAADTPLSAAYVMHTLAQALPDDVVLVEESPSTRAAMQQYLDVRYSGSFYVAANGGLGFAMPAAVGIQLARPERRVVCLVGDGSSLYSVQALWTAAQQGAPVVFVILHNGQYAILKSFGAFAGAGAVPGLDLPGLDLVSIAQGFGCAAEQVEQPEALAPALDRALAAGRPVVLDVVVDPNVPRLL